MKIILLNCLLILVTSCASKPEGFDLKSEAELSKEIKASWSEQSIVILEVKQSIHKDKIRIKYKNLIDSSEKFKVVKMYEFDKIYHIYLDKVKDGNVPYININAER